MGDPAGPDGDGSLPGRLRREMALLNVENVTSGYGRVMVVHDVSIYVDEDEIVTIIGPNGSGKSTLMKTIFGLLKPTQGRIVFNNMDITGLKAHEVAKIGIGYVPQLDNVFPNLTVSENIEMGAYLRSDDYEAEVRELLKIFPALKERMNVKARSLSGGERQILAITMALINRPKLLLLDEPSASLAPLMAQEILSRVKEIRDRGCAVLIVEQNARRCLEISNRGYVMVMGRKVLEGDAKGILQDERIGRLYLGRRG